MEPTPAVEAGRRKEAVTETPGTRSLFTRGLPNMAQQWTGLVEPAWLAERLGRGDVVVVD